MLTQNTRPNTAAQKSPTRWLMFIQLSSDDDGVCLSGNRLEGAKPSFSIDICSDLNRTGPQINDIYFGKVINSSADGTLTFVNIGEDITAVLKNKMPKEQPYYAGQHLITQIQQGERPSRVTGTKGATVVDSFKLIHRYAVLENSGSHINLSRKLSPEQQLALAPLHQALLSNMPQLSGIIRTQAFELVTDSEHSAALQDRAGKMLCQNWQQLLLAIKNHTQQKNAAKTGLIHRPFSLLAQHIFNLQENLHLTPLLLLHAKHSAADTIVQTDLAQAALVFPENHSRCINDCELKYLQQTLQALQQPVIHHPCGASLVIERTEALTIIDINRGAANAASVRNFINDQDERAENQPHSLSYQINITLAQTICDQIQLRAVSGIGVIDLLKMPHPIEKKKLVEAYKRLFHAWNPLIRVGQISELGLLEMSIPASIHKALTPERLSNVLQHLSN